MANPVTEEEKRGVAIPPTVHTSRLHEKTSMDTLGGQTLSPMTPAGSRPSDVSTPTAAATMGSGTNPFDTDIEAMVPTGTTDTRQTKCSGVKRTGSGNQDCQVWPSPGFWKSKAKAAKRKNHSCSCLSSLSPKKRMIVKILIGLFIVAAAIGIGFGISKPLGSSIWRPS